MFGKTVTRDIRTAEALGIGEVTIAEDTTLAVILIEYVVTAARLQVIWNFVALVVLHHLVDEAIGILITVRIIVISVIVAIEVGTVRKIDFLHVLLGDGNMLTGLAVAYQNQGVSSEASSSTTRKRLQLFQMFCTVGKGFIYIEILRQLQYRGVVCQHGCTLGEGISSAINRFVDIDMYVVPTHRWLLGSNLAEILTLVGFCNIYSGSVIYRHDVIIYTLRNQLTGKQMNLLLDGRSLDGSIIVLQVKILLVGTFQNILSIQQWIHLIVGRITHLYLGRTIDIARIGTTGYRTENVTIEDIHIGKTDDITLLTATIDEVG